MSTQTFIVATIHNSKLGLCLAVSSIETGLRIIREKAENQLERVLTPEELFDLENMYEVYNDEDCDNVFSWSIGFLE
jgi:hypothetical protein